MSGLSLFKIQSLVAIILCTSLSAWGTGKAVAEPGKTNGAAVVRNVAGTGAASTTADDDADADEATPAARTRSTTSSSASSSDDSSTTASFICKYMKNPPSNCEKQLSSNLSSLSGGGDPQIKACDSARENDTSKASEANSKQDALFGALDKQADMLINSAKTKEEADAAVAGAKLKYEQAVRTINLTLPIQQESIRNKVAKEMLTLKAAMIDIGKEIMAADNELRAAEVAINSAENQQMSKCTSFAGTKANAKLKEFDDAFKALKSAPNAYVNYDSSTVSGAKNRRNAKRARDAQAAYMSAYSACMAGQPDPQGGDIGPGPDLVQQNKDLAKAYETAKANHAKNLEMIEMKKQNLKEQMDNMEVGMNTEIKAAIAGAQDRADVALTEYNLAQNEATKMVRIGSLDMTYKGGFLNQQIEMLKGQAGMAAQKAQQANVTAMINCGDQGASLAQKQLQQQQQLQQTISNAARSAGAKGVK